MKGQRATQGFTIIEVIIFLAISGMMLAAMLVGVNGAISQQRYDEAVTSLYDFMQGQYNEVTVVKNAHPDTFSCAIGSGITDTGSGASPGTSECTIVGRLVSSTDGTTITSEPVYSIEQYDPTAATDIALLDSMGLVNDTSLIDTTSEYKLSWQTRFYTDASNVSTTTNFQLLLVRLPTSNLVRSYYTTDISASTIQDVYNLSSASADTLLVCVDAQGLSRGKTRGVEIGKNGINSSAVRLTSGRPDQC